MRKKNLSFLGLPHHEIYEDGTIKSINRVINTASGPRKYKGKKLSTKPTGNGYPHVTFNYDGEYKGFNVHRLLALCFIPNPNDKPCVNHIDGNKMNNSLDNLEWCTHVKNIRHAYKNGLMPIRKGNNSSSRKLNSKKVEQILDKVKNSDLSYEKIGKQFNVSGSCVGDIVMGKVWNNNKFSIGELENYINSNKITSCKELIKKLKNAYE